MSFLFFLALATAPMADPVAEARAQALEMEIRCVVCQNEPIAQSTADIAADMRTLVRERVAAGDSDDQIRTYFRDRYGDFVLLRPPFDARTWALWGAPFVFLAIGFAGIWSLRRWSATSGRALTPEQGER